MVRWIVAGLLMGIAGLACSQDVLKLSFAGTGERLVWMAQMPPESEPKDGIAANGTSLELKTTGKPDSERVFIWDKATGNLASKALREIKGPEWPVKPTDFTLITRVDVRVEHKGKPVETANVRLKDGRQDVSQIIDSTTVGTAAFWGVKPGQIKVEVTYRTEGKNADPIKQVFELGLQRKEAAPRLVVSIGDPVPTVQDRPVGASSGSDGSSVGGTADSTADAGGGTAADRPVRRSSDSPLGNLVGFLIAVAVAAAFVFFGLRWIKANQAKVQAQLEKLGMEIPGQPDEPPVASVQTPVAPAPPQKIVLSGSDPSNSTVVQTAPVVSGTPTFVAASGLRWQVPDGESVVSREQVEGLVIEADTSVSRRHATIVKDGDGVRVRDEGSTNGTYVNGRKIDSETLLQPGDEVQFGMAKFRFEG